MTLSCFVPLLYWVFRLLSFCWTSLHICSVCGHVALGFDCCCQSWAGVQGRAALRGAGLPWHCPLASLLAPSDFGEEPLAWSCVWLNHSQWLAQSCCFADSVHIFHVSRGFASFVLIELTVSDAMASKGKLDCFPSLISYTFSVAYSLIYY